MASREEPQVNDTRGLPDIPAPQETLFEEDPTAEDSVQAAATPEQNGDAPSPAAEASGDVVSPARPRGMASFPGGPPPVSIPPPTMPLFTQPEPAPAAPSFRVTTVESTAAFRPAGPPPPAPSTTQTPPALAAEPEEAEEAEVQVEAEAAAEPDADTVMAPEAAVEPAPEVPVEVETPSAGREAAAAEAPAAREAAAGEAPAAAEASAAAEAGAVPEAAEVTPGAASAAPEAPAESEVQTPPAKPARRPRGGRGKARERAEATTAEAATTGAAGPEAAAAEEPVVEGPAGRSRRRRSRSGRATAQAGMEPATVDSQALTQPMAALESTVEAGTAELPPVPAASSDEAPDHAATTVELPAGTTETKAGEGAADDEELTGAGSARTRARRRRRAAAKARLRSDEPAEPAARGDAATGETTVPAARAAAAQPAPARTGRPSASAAERPQGSSTRGAGRQRGAASAAPSAAPPADPSPAPATAPGAAPPAAEAGTDESAPTRGRSRGRRRVGSRSQGEAPAATVTEPATEPAPARTPAPSERSTRLEASRARGVRQSQGPDRGRRRRRGGLTEDQKRVLREGPERRMLVTEGAERTQIGVIEGSTLVEHYVTRKTGRSMVGNIYLGRVQNVLPGMEAAFVDIGKGRNAVLYAGEVNYNEEDLDGEAPRIEKALKPGQAILVQVTKDPIGAKGARLTTQVSLAGRYLVLQPEDSTFGISRRLPEPERVRLREILKEVRPKGLGLIVRTAAEGATADDLRADLARLQTRWETIERKAKKASPPAVIYQEPELVVRVIRDIFSPDFVELVVDAPGLYERVKAYLEEVAPDLLPKVGAHDGRLPLFEQYRVTEQIHKALERKVWLPSGGSLVIDQTEAMTVVDVNTGKYVGKSNLEETVVATNLEAAEEIVRQLRLRDIGGIIIIDFIDMLFEKNQHAVVERLRSALARDKTKSQVMEVSSLGLVQMTRKRVSGGLLDSFSETCPACEGRGVVITHEV